MSSSVQALADLHHHDSGTRGICLACGCDDEEQNTVCIHSGGTGVLMLGLHQECENCGGSKVIHSLDKRLPDDEYRQQIEDWHATGDPSVLTEFPCPDDDWGEGLSCGGKGWVLKPEAEQLGGLVRQFPGVQINWEFQTQQWEVTYQGEIAFANTPEEAFASTILQSLRTKH